MALTGEWQSGTLHLSLPIRLSETHRTLPKVETKYSENSSSRITAHSSHVKCGLSFRRSRFNLEKRDAISLAVARRLFSRFNIQEHTILTNEGHPFTWSRRKWSVELLARLLRKIQAIICCQTLPTYVEVVVEANIPRPGSGCHCQRELFRSVLVGQVVSLVRGRSNHRS